MTVRRRIGGFTLVEILVAFVLLTMLLGGFLNVYSSGLNSVRSSEAQAAAVQVAEARMTTIGVEIPLAEGVETGLSDDGYRWTTEISPFEPEGEEASAGLAALRVRVKVAWQEEDRERSVVLETLRLVPVTSDDRN